MINKNLIIALAVCALMQYVYPWNKAMENPNLFEGDIVLTPKQQQAVKEGDFGFGAKKNPTELWPNGVVPYEISPELANNQKAMKALNEAFDQYHTYTCLRFRKRQNGEKAYVRFFKGGGCSSGVGYGGGMTSISLDEGCWWRTTVMHEIAHTLGFYHEQSRPDRDNYIEIITKNIASGAEGQFTKQTYANVDLRNIPYDYRSMMHYNWNAFGQNEQMTIRTKDPRDQYEIGQREGFSHLDIKEINAVYNCKGTYPTLPPYVRPPADCYDLGGGCAESKAEGRCTDSSWQYYMKKACRRTCGFCGIGGGGGPIPTHGTGGGSGCSDVVTDCHKFLDKCNEQKDTPWRTYVERSCRKSCKFC